MDELLSELVKREVAARAADQPDPQWRLPPAWHVNQPAPQSVSAISPGALQTLGGLADAASTYTFLKRGTGSEENPMLGFSGGRPAATAAGVLGGLALSKLGAAALRKVSPRLADAVGANLGAQQLSIAVNNLDDRRSLGGFQRYGQAMTHSAIREANKR